MLPDAERRAVFLLGMGWSPDQPGGLNRYFRDLWVALGQAGESVQGVTIGPAVGAPAGLTVAANVDDPLPRRLLAVLDACRSAGRDIDVVDAHFALYALLPVLGPLRDRQLVVHFQGPWGAESAVSGAGRPSVVARHAIEGAVYRRARRFIVLSPAFRRLLVERYGISPWKIRVIPPGVDVTRFAPGDRRAARARLGLAPNAWVAATVRRLNPRMGVEVLLRAWSELQDGILLIAGDGPERKALEAEALRLGLLDRARFLGRVSDEELVDVYRAADVTVVPSVALEGFGLVILESLACGTPVIGSNLDGIPRGLGGLDRSLLVPASDAGRLAERLRTARNGTRPLPDARSCRAHAESFSWQSAAEATRRVYEETRHRDPRHRMRVVFLDHTAQLSGGELALSHLLPALGVDAHVILAEPGPLLDLLDEAGISAEVLPLDETARNVPRTAVRGGGIPFGSAIATASYTVRLARRLRALHPDVVHTNSLKSCLYGGLAARLVGIPVVWHIRDRIAPDYMPMAAVRLVRAAARHIPTAIIANSATTAATLASLASSLTVIPIPSPVPQSPRSMDPARPVDDRRPIRIGMVGRLAPWKGQEIFLRAFARAFPSGDEYATIVGSALFGEDEYAARLPELARELGIASRVEWRGFREDVWTELARLDILVHASVVPEPFGQVVVEGMAARLPVIASGAGGPAEIITDGRDGVLTPPGDVEALARAMQRLASDPVLRARLGAAGQQRARHYAPDRIAAEVMGVYARIVSK